MMSEEGKQVKTQVFTLGEIILKLEMPEHFIEAVNKAIDERGDSMPDWNPQLAGKIKKEKLLNPILNDDIKGTFMMCFQEYMKRSGSVLVNTHQLSLDNVWVNDMYAGEYNPAHFHSSKNSLVGLSSVLFLKVPVCIIFKLSKTSIVLISPLFFRSHEWLFAVTKTSIPTFLQATANSSGELN